MTRDNVRTDSNDTGRKSSDGPSERQFVKFSFFKVDHAYRHLEPQEQRRLKRECVGAIQAFDRRMLLRSYSLVGLRGDADFLLWQVALTPEPFQELMTAIINTELGRYVDVTHSFLAVTRRSNYEFAPSDGETTDQHRIVIAHDGHKYLFVYPFIKTRAWYALPFEQRQTMMNEHIRVGRKYPQIKLNTTYSFGIDDQEFVVAFEGDNPSDFVDLVLELRESEASQYTLRDTPMFTCRHLSLAETFDTLGGPPIAEEVDAAISDGDGWIEAVSVADLPAGSSASVFAAGREIALFNVQGQIYALANRCSHARGPLSAGVVEADPVNCTVTCPWHYARFDLTTGEVVDGLASEPVSVYDTDVRDGDIYVRTGGVLEAAARPG